MTIDPRARQTVSAKLEQAFQQAVARHHAGNLEEAGALYKAVLQIDPAHPVANHNLGILAMQTGLPATGLPHFLAALEADPTHRQYWLSYIDALFQDHQPEEARQVLTLARQQGLEGPEVEALEQRMDGDLTTGMERGLPSAPSPVTPQGKEDMRRSRKPKANRLAKHVPSREMKLPSPQEINAVIRLFNEGRDVEAATLAHAMTMRFPRHGFGWKALGAVLMQQGNNADALPALRQSAALSPHDADVHSNLGLVLLEMGRLDQAEASCRAALRINPGLAAAHVNLGIALHDLGRFDEAEASHRRALKIQPDFAEAHSNLGNAHRKQGRLGEAESSYRRALLCKPDFAEAYSNLGITLKDLGRLDEAEAACRKALAIKPAYADAHSNLGVVLHDLGRWGEAADSYRRALEIRPNSAETLSNLGATLQNLDLLDEAEANHRLALQIKPGLADAHYNLGTTLKNLERLDEANASYLKASQLGIDAARTKRALMLPAIMGSRQQVLETRARFERNLDALMADRVALADPLKSIGETNFYLAYHGLNDRDLQIKVAKYYEQACPSLLYVSPHCARPAADTQRPTRVGVFSRFLYSHSVSLCFSKVIEALSVDVRFDVALISEHAVDEQIYSGFVGRRLSVANDLARAREAIAGLELDILIYLDIGMEPLSYFLAFSRLARTQCVLPGHPVTTGIGNVNYFLSSGLFEPECAARHYSEKLICLPQPVFHFARPAVPTTLKTRQNLGLPAARHLYMCPMKLQKLHPDFDDVLSRVLELDANGVVVLFEDHTCPHWKTALLKRFATTLTDDARSRIVFLPWLRDSGDFISAVATADVVLDPFHFGIGSTVIVTGATGTPLVTKAGEFMRGRVGAYWCQVLGVEECIVDDTEAYARKAVEIAGNLPLRNRLRATILKNNFRLYENLQPVNALIGFLGSIARTGEVPESP